MERQSLYEKFQNLTWQQQLGNLAATLAKISSQATEPKLDKLTLYLLREAALMIEWSVKNVPQEYHLEMASFQREYLQWRKIFPLEDARILLSLNTRYQSYKILQIAGYLDAGAGKMPTLRDITPVG